MKKYLKLSCLGCGGLIVILFAIGVIVSMFEDEDDSISGSVPTASIETPKENLTQQYGSSAGNSSTQQSASSIHRQQQEKRAPQSEPASSAGLLAAPNIYNHYSREAPDNETIQFKGFPWWAESGREGSETIILQIHAVTDGNLICVFPDTVENVIQLARFGTTMPRPFVTFEGVVSEWVGSDLWINSCRVLAIEKR